VSLLEYKIAKIKQEIITGTIPYYPQCQNDAKVVTKLLQKLLPERVTEQFGENERADRMWGLLVQCWDHDPAARPTARQTLDLVRTLLEMIHTNGIEPFPNQLQRLIQETAITVLK
jgi:hypothetical protein